MTLVEMPGWIGRSYAEAQARTPFRLCTIDKCLQQCCPNGPATRPRQHGDANLRNRFLDEAISRLSRSEDAIPCCAKRLVPSVRDQCDVTGTPPGLEVAA